MPFVSRRARLNLTDEDTIWLERLAQSRTESAARVQRAQMVLRYAQGQTVSAIAAAFKTNRPKVERCVSKALELGVRAAMRDLPGRGRRRPWGDVGCARIWIFAAFIIVAQQFNGTGISGTLLSSTHKMVGRLLGLGRVTVASITVKRYADPAVRDWSILIVIRSVSMPFYRDLIDSGHERIK